MMENKITPELIEKAKLAKSAEEIATLATENGVEMAPEEARMYYEQFHKTGELADEELDNVAGGGCKTKAGGKKYTVVTCNCKCFTGQYKKQRSGQLFNNVWKAFTKEGERCGSCVHLKFDGDCTGTGYCELS